MKCVECKKDIAKDSRFCIECGASQPGNNRPEKKSVTYTPPVMRYCMQCAGEIIEAQAQFLLVEKSGFNLSGEPGTSTVKSRVCLRCGLTSFHATNPTALNSRLAKVKEEIIKKARQIFGPKAAPFVEIIQEADLSLKSVHQQLQKSKKLTRSLEVGSVELFYDEAFELLKQAE